MNTKTECYLAESKTFRGVYLRIGRGRVAATVIPHWAQKFRTKDGCQAFIDEWAEDEFEPVDHAFE